MSDWRSDPATEAQKKRMREDGIKFSENITKGEASDLIGSLLEPEDDEKEILKFFKSKGISQMSQTDARKKIEDLFSNPDNKSKWDNRPPSKEQKDIYNFFKITIPTNLSYKEAQKNIDLLFEDETKLDAWEKREDEKEELKAWFEDYYEIINDDRDYYDCKKIGKKFFRQIVNDLESSGITKAEIENNSEIVFKKAIEIEPTIKKVARTNRQSVSQRNYNSTRNKGCSVLFFFIIIVSSILYYTS